MIIETKRLGVLIEPRPVRPRAAEVAHASHRWIADLIAADSCQWPYGLLRWQWQVSR